MNQANQYSQRIKVYQMLKAARNIETFKISRKGDVQDVPVILEDGKFKIIINSVKFRNLKINKTGRFLLVIM